MLKIKGARPIVGVFTNGFLWMKGHLVDWPCMTRKLIKDSTRSRVPDIHEPKKQTYRIIHQALIWMLIYACMHTLSYRSAEPAAILLPSGDQEQRRRFCGQKKFIKHSVHVSVSTTTTAQRAVGHQDRWSQQERLSVSEKRNETLYLIQMMCIRVSVAALQDKTWV